MSKIDDAFAAKVVNTPGNVTFAGDGFSVKGDLRRAIFAGFTEVEGSRSDTNNENKVDRQTLTFTTNTKLPLNTVGTVKDEGIYEITERSLSPSGLVTYKLTFVGPEEDREPNMFDDVREEVRSEQEGQ